MKGGTTHPSKCGTPLGTPKTTPWFWGRQRSYEGACRWDVPPIQATGEGNLTEALPAFPEQFKQRDQTELPLTPCLPPPTPKRLDSRQERAAWKLFSALNRPRLRQTCVQRAPQAPICREGKPAWKPNEPMQQSLEGKGRRAPQQASKEHAPRRNFGWVGQGKKFQSLKPSSS